MTEYQRRARLLNARLTLCSTTKTDLADYLGVSRPYVALVLLGKTTSNPLLKKIEQKLDEQQVPKLEYAEAA